MPLAFYKPNKYNTGSAASFNVNSKGGVMYAEIVQQVSWDEKSQTGSFYNRDAKEHGKKVQIQITRDEIGALIYTIQSKKEFKTVHESEKQISNIGFSLYYKWDAQAKAFKTDEPPVGFSLTISRTLKENKADKANFKIAFTFAEAMVFLEFCRFCLERIFTSIHSEDKKKADEYQKNKQPDPAF